MEIITKQDATELLKPHLPKLSQIMAESLDELTNVMNVLTIPLNSRTKCNILHNIAIEKAKTYFSDSADVSIKSKYQSIQLIFDSKIIARIKKVNKEKLSCNVKTLRNDRIIGQQLSLFENIPQMTFVDFGYTMDATWTSYESLLVVCRVQDSVNWFFEFGNDREKFKTIEVIEPITPLVKEEKQISIKIAK